VPENKEKSPRAETGASPPPPPIVPAKKDEPAPRPAEVAKATATVVELTAANWEEEVVRSDKPVLVDFYAVWCGPCQQLAPTIDKMANDFAGKVKVARLNIDQAREISARYSISAIPQIMVFKGSDQPVERPSPGGKSAADIAAMLNRHLAT
jgi:thioredoxin 1